MVDWTFEYALAAIQSPPSIPASVLQSTDGLHLGDIHFAKIQTTLQMHAVPLAILEKWVEEGRFNPEQMAESDYSHSMAILITLSSNTQGTVLESAGHRVDHLPVQGTDWPVRQHSSSYQVCSLPVGSGKDSLLSKSIIHFALS